MQGYSYRYKIHDPKNKLLALKIVMAVFAFIAGLFIIIAAIIISVGKVYADEYKDADEVNAVIDQISVKYRDNGSESYEVYVNYNYNGQEYNHVRLELVVNPEELWEGESMTVFLRKGNPTKATMSTDLLLFHLLAGVFGGIGVLFLIVFIVLIFVKKKIKQKEVSDYPYIQQGYDH